MSFDYFVRFSLFPTSFVASLYIAGSARPSADGLGCPRPLPRPSADHFVPLIRGNLKVLPVWSKIVASGPDLGGFQATQPIVSVREVSNPTDSVLHGSSYKVDFVSYVETWEPTASLGAWRAWLLAKLGYLILIANSTLFPERCEAGYRNRLLRSKIKVPVEKPWTKFCFSSYSYLRKSL